MKTRKPNGQCSKEGQQELCAKKDAVQNHQEFILSGDAFECVCV